jgi:purine nucleoside phosphorylase
MDVAVGALEDLAAGELALVDGLVDLPGARQSPIWQSTGTRPLRAKYSASLALCPVASTIDSNPERTVSSPVERW